MRRKRSPEPVRPTGGGVRNGPPAASRGPGRVVLAGEWPPARAAELRSLLTVVDDAPVDWLLVAVGTGSPPPGLLPGPAQRYRPRVAVVDPDGRWPEGADSDVYLAGAVEPGELVAALRLAGTGFTVRRTATPARPAHRAGATDAATDPIARGLPAGLTGREVELLRALCAGLGNDQIARRLHISRSTVEFHLTRIFRKLEVYSRAEAIVRALRYDPTLAAAQGRAPS